MGESQQRAISDQYTVGAEEMACVILFEGTGANNNAESEFGKLVSIVSRNHLTVPQNPQKHMVGHYSGVGSNKYRAYQLAQNAMEYELAQARR